MRNNILKLSKNFNYNNIYEKINNCKNIYDYIESLAKKQKVDEKEIEEELNKLESINATFITFIDDIYPNLLKIIEDFPLVLYCIGNLELLKNDRKVSIVGSRNCSINSFNFTEKIAKEVSSYGYIIVSGMAKGIDAAAHRGSLKNGTIAVLGSGLDVIYPKENEYLYKEILKNNGLIISEFPIGTSPRPENFPRRNRIIAGLSRGVIVMEAGQKSGTMHTINQANRYGRETMIFPGSPYDERFAGSNNLLKNGANMVIDTKDIIECIENFIGYSSVKDNISVYYDYDNTINEEIIDDCDNKNIDEIILSKLDYSPINLNELIDDLFEYDLSLINSTISKLQLENKIVVDFGKISLKLN